VTERQKECTALRAQGLTYRQIAARLGVSEQAAWQAVNRDRVNARRRGVYRKRGTRGPTLWPGQTQHRKAAKGSPRGRPLGGRNHRWTPPDDALFGSLTILEVAGRLGISPTAAYARYAKIRKRRKAMSVDPYTRTAGGSPDPAQEIA
jgi:hypothetical protein